MLLYSSLSVALILETWGGTVSHYIDVNEAARNELTDVDLLTSP